MEKYIVIKKMNNEPYDKELITKLNDIVRSDTAMVNPQCGVTVDCQHQAIGKYNTDRDIDFNCGVATRYYEDENYARAYALSSYKNGIAIFVDKEVNKFTIFVLGEDDGLWFISNSYNLCWIEKKTIFISLVSEALSILNTNFKESKKN